jgi:hypothetical protein
MVYRLRGLSIASISHCIRREAIIDSALAVSRSFACHAGTQRSQSSEINDEVTMVFRLKIPSGWLWFCCIAEWLGCLHSAIVADEPPRFNRDVLPILAEYCFECHGFDAAKRQAELRLDREQDSKRRLPSGTTPITHGDLEASEVWKRVTSSNPQHRMPPAETGKQVSESQQNTLRRWILAGAEYEPHWAFVPPRSIVPPEVPTDEHAIDRFVKARLNILNRDLSPEASRATLIRRVSLDLTGLPPTPLEIDAFVHDQRPDAWQRVIDRLLDSEHFGERWARWWLDLAHYGDSDGYLQDFLRPVAWRYRQWVIDAFNRDMPFDSFTIEQLAGDLLLNATESQRMATGFLRNTLSNREGGADLEEFRVQQVLDRTATFGTTWLGLTLGCAQCHDHKFDPIPQKDFYRLYAYFNNADEANIDAPLPGEQDAYVVKKSDYDRQRLIVLEPVRERLAVLQSEWEAKMLHTEAHPGEDFAWDRALELLGLQWGQGLGEGQLEGLNIIKTPQDRRTQQQQDRITDYFLGAPPAEFGDRFRDMKLGELKTKLDALSKTLPSITRAPAMMSAARPRSTFIHIRGDFRRNGDEVQPGTLSIISVAPQLNEKGDRLELARWVVAKDNPLTSRVLVNRLWQELFGRGIVSTSENFGVRGQLPSHPELLDWLATEFQRGGWSIKGMLRLITMSQTYRQSSSASPDMESIDPNNQWFGRQRRLRLSGEAIRDSALAVSGLLNRTLGGPSVKPPQPESVSQEGYKNDWRPSVGGDRYRRGIYTFIQRTSPYSQFTNFDFPDTSRSCTRRERTNTPVQALQLLNDPVFVEAATALAIRMQRVRGDDSERIKTGFEWVLGRQPKPHESDRLLQYLGDQRKELTASAPKLTNLASGTEYDAREWILVASVLLNLDEFIHRE